MRMIALVLATAGGLSGCASPEQRVNEVFRPEPIAVERSAPLPADAAASRWAEIPKDQRLREVDLAEMIHEGERDMDKALRKFRASCAEAGAAARCRIERNAIQDRLLVASNSICSEYKSNLKKAHANTNLFYGGSSTVLGGLGALVQSANPARIFSGAAAIASGLRAEVNQTMYAMLAAEVITKAMDKTRADRLRNIEDHQQREIGNYSLERSIADAIVYHEGCSMLAGLQEASDAVSQSENLGIKSMQRALEDIGQVVQIQIGRKQRQLAEKDTVFLVAACTAANSTYLQFITRNSIDAGVADYKDLADRWTALFASAGYCKDHDKPTGTAALADKRYQDLVASFNSLNEDKEKDRILGLVAAQQAEARALAESLQKTLNAVIEGMRDAQKRVQAAGVSIGNLKAVSIASVPPGESDANVLQAARSDTRAFGRAAEDALAKARRTVAWAPAPAQQVALAAAAKGARELSSDATPDQINQARQSLSVQVGQAWP